MNEIEFIVDTYGDMLLRSGRISKEDYDRALEYAKTIY